MTLGFSTSNSVIFSLKRGGTKNDRLTTKKIIEHEWCQPLAISKRTKSIPTIPVNCHLYPTKQQIISFQENNKTS
jgi:hypothetical protein